MSLTTFTIPPLDPYGFTGPTRVMAGIARMGSVTLGAPYGSNGAPEFARWLYAGATGNASIILWDGSTQVLTGLAAGVWHPIFTIGVNTAGTTATGLFWGS